MLLALALVTIHTDFEGGSLGRVEKVSDTHFRLGAKGDKDQDGRNRQANWYLFRVDGASPGTPLTLDMVDLPGEYNYRPNRGAITADTPPVISYDNEHWQQLETFSYDKDEPKLRLTIQPERKRFWIAHVTPYTNQHLERLRKRIKGNADFAEERIGKSVQGRDLFLWTIGAKSNPGPHKTVWLMFRQHSWETGSSWTGEGAVLELIANAALRKGVVWKVFPFCDPDGVHRGNVRFNGNGFDLNRNWDVEDPVKMPEITAQRNAIRKWLDSGKKIDLFYSLHNTETGEYLEGPPQGHRELAERLFARLVADTTFSPTRKLFFAETTTTPGKPGRMTVVQGLSHQFQLPAFLMEQRISKNEKFGRRPLPEDRMRFGRELVRAMRAAVE